VRSTGGGENRKDVPVSNNPCGRTLYGLVANQDEDLVTAKVDYTINAKHSIFDATC